MYGVTMSYKVICSVSRNKIEVTWSSLLLTPPTLSLSIKLRNLSYYPQRLVVDTVKRGKNVNGDRGRLGQSQ